MDHDGEEAHVTGRCGYVGGDFLLHHDDQGTWARLGGYELSDDGRGGVVRQIGDDLVAVREDVGGVEIEGVLVEDGDVLALGESVGKGAGEFGIEFDGHEFGDAVYEDAGESAFAGAYFENLVGIGELGGGHDSLGHIVVNEEVLSEPASPAWGGASVGSGSQGWGNFRGCSR